MEKVESETSDWRENLLKDTEPENGNKVNENETMNNGGNHRQENLAQPPGSPIRRETLNDRKPTLLKQNPRQKSSRQRKALGYLADYVTNI